MKNIIKEVLRKLGIQLTRYTPRFHEGKTVSLSPAGACQGNVLLSYIIDSFLLRKDELVSNAHTHDWESLLIARTFINLGYTVDVIDYRDRIFVPKKEYSFFVAARTNFQRIAQLLNEDCTKIVHLETSHWLFNNCASYKRCLALQARKRVTVRSRRIVESNLAIEYADYATIKGNQFTASTYVYARKPFFCTPNPACFSYAWPEGKDYETCRKNFLWFGSQGLVHKGLDLVLEVFTEMPDYELTICGPIQQERDFEKAYFRELYQTPNIHTVGWVDVGGQEFIEITNKCVGFIYPSCAEGQSGSVVTCLQAGIIPIISYESGVDVHDFGVILNDCSIEEIEDSIRMISGRSVEKLKRMSRKAWEFARENHTRERFSEEYRKIIDKISTTHNAVNQTCRTC